MATVDPYETAAGKRWRVRYRVDGRPTQKRGFTTVRDARAFAATVEVSMMRGEYVTPTDGRVTIGSLGPDWLARKQGVVKPSHYRPLETAWRVHVEPRWGNVQLGQVRKTDVQAWVSGMAASRSASVVIRAAGVLAGILDDAVTDRRLHVNEARDVTLPRKVSKPHVYLTHEQVRDLAVEAGAHRALVLTFAYTGLRWGEAGALRVSDLDLLRRRLTVNRNVVRVGADMIVGTPKSHERRTVPIPAFVVEHLARQCEGKGRDDLVFPAGSGGFVQQSNSTRGWWHAAVAKAGIPRVTPHDMRHTCASFAVSAGANVKVLQRMLGHKSAAMTLDTYAALFADDLDAVGERLDAVVREKSVAKLWPNGS